MMPINLSGELELHRTTHAPIYGAVEQDAKTTETHALTFRNKKIFIIRSIFTVFVLCCSTYVAALIRSKTVPILSVSSRASHLHILPSKTFPSARCLDGSQGAYYFRPAATLETADKWVFSLQGGGECVTEEACAMRALNDLGSSIEFERDGSRFMVQYQDQSIKENPDLCSWNHVFIRYCTGDMHFGNVKKPGHAQWGWAHFSGAIIVDSVIEDCINNHGLGKASTVVWSGDSAGGIGSLASVDRAAEMIPSAKVVAAPIAGFYFDNRFAYSGPGALGVIPLNIDALQNYWNLWEMVVPPACADAYPDTPWACVLAEYNLPYTASDVFVSEMLLDSVQLFLHSGVPEYNKNTSSSVKRFGENMTKALSTYLFDNALNSTESPRRTGLFAPSCFSHTMFSSKDPLLLDPLSNSAVSFIDVFADWLFERDQFSTIIIEDCCSGTEVKFSDICPTPTPSRTQISLNTSF